MYMRICTGNLLCHIREHRFEHFASLLDILDYAFCFAAESAWHYVCTQLPTRCFGKIGFAD